MNKSVVENVRVPDYLFIVCVCALEHSECKRAKNVCGDYIPVSTK